MIRDPKVLPWLAKKAGVPYPVAQQIWRRIVEKAPIKSGTDVHYQQIRALRRELRAWVEARERESEKLTPTFPWYPLYRNWADCQHRVIRTTWLAWAGAAQAAGEGWRRHRRCEREDCR